MKNILLIFLLIPFLLKGQTFSLSGKVMDDNTFAMEGVEIVLNQGKYHCISDEKGEFKFKSLPKGQYHLDAYYLGYTTTHLDINLQANQKEILITLLSSTESLNEVEIHGNATLQKQREASLMMEVANADYIQTNLKTTLMKSLEELPGVSTIDVGSGQSKPVIRGLSFNQVVVVENGIKHEGQQWGEDHGLEIDPYSVKQVEVIKGPSSLLYGSDAIGGIILINNAAYPLDQGYKAQLNLNTKTFNASYGGSLNLETRKNQFYTDSRLSFSDYADYKVPTDSVNIYSYRAALQNKRLRNTAGQDLGFNTQIGWVNDKHHTRIYSSYFYANNAFFANAHGLEPRFVDVDLHDASNRDVQEPNQTVQHFKLQLNSTWYKSSGKWDMEIGYQKNYRKEMSPYVNHGFMPAVFPEQMNFASNLERLYDKDIVAANIKKEINTNSVKWQTGLNADWQHNKINGWSFILPEFTKWALGGFIYGKYNISDKVIINSGLRYDIGSITSTKYFDWFTSETNEGTTEYLQRAYELNKKYHNLTWALGLSYNSSNFNLKTNIGKSFRMPIAKEIASNGVNYHHFSYEIGNANLKPEISYQWDLGLEWHQTQWAFQVSPFLNYFPNFIYLNPTADYDYLYGAGNQIYRYTEAKVVRWGTEMHGHYNFSTHWKWDVIAEYVYAEQLSGSKKGSGLPFSPPTNVITKLHYNLKDFTFLKETVLSLSHKYTAAQNQIVPPEEATAASSVWDFALQTAIEFKNSTRWEFQFQINNILNTRYFNHTNYYRIIGVPEAGRNLTVAIKIPIL